mgnify:CR=1 FL=1
MQKQKEKLTMATEDTQSLLMDGLQVHKKGVHIKSVGEACGHDVGKDLRG